MNNVVGKMLIVMQLVFSILFMCFAGAVYTFQADWVKRVADVQNKYENEKQNYDTLKEDYDTDTKDLNQRLAAAELRVQEETAKVVNLESAANSIQETLSAVQLERDKAKADSEVATTEAAARVAESRALNKEVQSLRGRIAELRQELQTIEDQLLDGQGRLAGAEEREEQLLAENANLKDLLRLNEIDPRTIITPGDVPDQIEKVNGFIEDTLVNKNRTQELVQITIGSDDKIYKDMQLIVHRGDDFICHVRVMKVLADKAVCVVIDKTKNVNRQVQVGDNVTTKL